MALFAAFVAPAHPMAVRKVSMTSSGDEPDSGVAQRASAPGGAAQPTSSSSGAAQPTLSAAQPTFAALVCNPSPAALEAVRRVAAASDVLRVPGSPSTALPSLESLLPEKSSSSLRPEYLSRKKEYALANIILAFAGASASHRLNDCSPKTDYAIRSLLVYLFWIRDLDSSYRDTDTESENAGDDRQISDHTPLDTRAEDRPTVCGWLRQYQGEPYCFMCRKHATEGHLTSQNHLRRVAWYEHMWPQGYYPEWCNEQEAIPQA